MSFRQAHGYATISGILTIPLTIAKAAAPLAAAALYTHTGSYTPVLAATATACLLAATGDNCNTITPGAPRIG
jgi:hypothetical protein